MKIYRGGIVMIWRNRRLGLERVGVWEVMVTEEQKSRVRTGIGFCFGVGLFLTSLGLQAYKAS